MSSPDGGQGAPLGIELKVKTLDGKTYTYTVQPTTTVAELKAMVAKDTGIAANAQRIIFRGKVLKDAATLSQTNGVLDGGSVVHVVSRPPEAERAGGTNGAASNGASGASPLFDFASAAGRQQHGTGAAAPFPGGAGMNLNAFQTAFQGNVGTGPAAPVLMGGFALGTDGGGGDGMLFNQFISQALGGLVGGAAGGGLAGQPVAQPPSAEELAQADHRRFLDMTAFADFGQAYLGTISDASEHYRMRADVQQRHTLQRQQLLHRHHTLSPEQQRVMVEETQRFHERQAEIQADQGVADSALARAMQIGGPNLPELFAATGAGGAPVLNLSFADMRAARTFPDAGSGARSDSSAASTIAATPVASGASDRVEGGVGSAASPAAPAQPSATLLPDVAALEPAAAPEELPAPAAASTQDSSASIVVDTEISAEAAAEAQAEADAEEQEDIATGSDSQEQLDTLAAMARLSEAANAPPLVLPPGSTSGTAAGLAAAPPPSTDPARSVPEVHELVTCDGCGVSPISGPRWKCSECADFDLCDICHRQFRATGQNHMPGHVFTRIPQRPRLPPAAGRPPIINGTRRRTIASVASGSAALAPDVARLLQTTVNNFDAMRPHLEALRAAMSSERQLTGLERDRAEGLAINVAPAVRDMAAILTDLAPLLSNLEMGDEGGHARIDMSCPHLHVPSAYRTLETRRREQYLQRSHLQNYRLQQRQAAQLQAQRQTGDEPQQVPQVGSSSHTTTSSASRAGGGAGTAAPAAAAAPRSAAPAETPIGAASIAVDPDLVIIEDVDEDGDPIDMPGLMDITFDDDDDAAVSPFAAATTAQGLEQLRQRLEGLGAPAAGASGVSPAIFTPSAPTNTRSAGTNRQNAASSTQSAPSTTSSSYNTSTSTSSTTSYSSSASSTSTSSSAAPTSVPMASVSSTGTRRVSGGAAPTGASMPLPAGIAAFVLPGSAGGPQSAYPWQQMFGQPAPQPPVGSANTRQQAPQTASHTHSSASSATSSHSVHGATPVSQPQVHVFQTTIPLHSMASMPQHVPQQPMDTATAPNIDSTEQLHNLRDTLMRGAAVGGGGAESAAFGVGMDQQPQWGGAPGMPPPHFTGGPPAGGGGVFGGMPGMPMGGFGGIPGMPMGGFGAIPGMPMGGGGMPGMPMGGGGMPGMPMGGMMLGPFTTEMGGMGGMPGGMPIVAGVHMSVNGQPVPFPGGMGGGDTNMNMFGPVFQQLMQQQMHQQMNHQPQQHTPTQPQQSRTPQPQPPPQPPQPPPHAQQGVPNMFATGSAPGMASAHQQAAAAAAAAAARATGGIGGMHMPAAMQDMIQNQIQQQMAANGMPSFGGMHVHMTVNGESVPMPPMPGTAPGGMPSMSGSGAPGGMPMPMPGMPGEVPGGDQNLLGAASVFQQLMQMQQQQQQRQQQGQPSPTPPSAPPPHAPAHPQQPPPNMHFGAANLPSGFEQIQQQIHQQATAAAAAAVAGAGLQMSPDMQEMIQSQIQQQLQGMGMQGMQGMPMPPHGGPQQPPHHPRNAPVPAQEPQMATFVNAGGPDQGAGPGGVGLVLGVGGMQVPMGVGGMQVPMQLPMGMDLGHMMMPSGGRDARDAYAGGYLAPENEVGFIEGFLLVVRDHLPSGDLFELVRGDVAGLQGVQPAMSRYLVEDLLGQVFDHQDLADCAEEVADSIIDGITVEELIRQDEEVPFPDVAEGDGSVHTELRELLSRVKPGVNIDKLMKICLTQHCRLFLNLVTGQPVPPTETNPYPFSMGLRRWLSWMLGDVLRQLTQSFEGGREDALLFLRNFITVRFAHGTASVSARGLGAGPGSMHNMAFSHVVTEGLIDDMIALIDTYIHETGRS